VSSKYLSIIASRNKVYYAEISEQPLYNKLMFINQMFKALEEEGKWAGYQPVPDLQMEQKYGLTIRKITYIPPWLQEVAKKTVHRLIGEERYIDWENVKGHLLFFLPKNSKIKERLYAISVPLYLAIL